eukprot:978322-Prorocentrum_minimum.AAC.1
MHHFLHLLLHLHPLRPRLCPALPPFPSGKFSKRATKGGFVEVDNKFSLHIPVENAATYTYSGPREVYDSLTSNHQRLVQEYIADCIPHAQQVVAELSGIPKASVKLSGFTFLFSFDGTAGQVPHIDASREDYPVFCAVGTEIIPTTVFVTRRFGLGWGGRGWT